ncbi:MAG: thioredoxin [Gammaproteobacteria bacterium]|nr:thioredoxin [Gammaproteobacteria bacterium]
MADSPHIIQLDESNFVQVVVEGSDQQPVLVDFWADWCGPCKSLMPILEKLAVEYNGAFVLAKLDTEAHPGIAQQLGIRSLPTVKLFKDRQLVDEFMGALPEAEVRKFLDQHVVAGAAGEDEDEGPTNPGLQAAMQLAEQGELEQARQILQQLQAEDPSDKDVLLALGQVCVSLGDLETASSCVSALPEEEQSSNAALRLTGTIELAREAAGETLDPQALQQECESNPDNSEARYKLAIATALGGDMQSAMDHLLKLVQKDPNYNEGAPREKLLALFNIMGDDPIVGVYRRKLFALLH